VQRLVQLHGGHVVARSDGKDRGSEFIVSLPLIHRAPTASRPRASSADGAPRRLVVVDDNDDLRRTLEVMLRAAGHRVETAADGLSGLDLIRSVRPDLALVDIGLPGIDGYELARRLRADPDGDQYRLVAVTGYGHADDCRRALEAGFNEHLVKPVQRDTLLELVGKKDWASAAGPASAGDPCSQSL
jgi:CheY-like chemotaxis protein